MTAWALLVVLAANTSGQVPVTWHASREACEQQRAVEVFHLAITGREVEMALCQLVRMPALKAPTGELLR
jgi:hypothetical protein